MEPAETVKVGPEVRPVVAQWNMMKYDPGLTVTEEPSEEVIPYPVTVREVPNGREAVVPVDDSILEERLGRIPA